MGKITLIGWCHHTFNGWVGCTRVSPACDHRYAAAWAHRYDLRDNGGRELWDTHAERQRTSVDKWREPVAWDREALEAGERRRVFCASLSDVFDNRVPSAWRADLWQLIRATSALDWLLLTKRPQNIADMLPADWGRLAERLARRDHREPGGGRASHPAPDGDPCSGAVFERRTDARGD
jgi:protein gp37